MGKEGSFTVAQRSMRIVQTNINPCLNPHPCDWLSCVHKLYHFHGMLSVLRCCTVLISVSALLVSECRFAATKFGPRLDPHSP